MLFDSQVVKLSLIGSMALNFVEVVSRSFR